MTPGHDSEQDLPVARSVARDVAARAAGYPFQESDDPRRAERELGQFALQWALAHLQSLGVMGDAGEVYDLDELKRRLGVAAKYDRYFEALIRRLAAEGLLTIEGRAVETTARVRDYALRDVEAQVAEFKRSFPERHPSCAGLLGFMSTCLDRFDEILTGRVDAADVLFQDGNMDVFGEVFRSDLVADYFNRLVAEAVLGAVTRLRQGDGRRVRIVEVGAGTGGTTAAILEALQPLASLAGSIEFVFTDISRSFLRHARRRFGERYPWLDYRTLDIEKDLARQGFDPHSFDVVVAANVLHDTRDIEFTLEQTKRLLKPGGLLVLNEFTAVKDCLFFSGALLHGYWLFEDPDRRQRDSCLLSVPQWREALDHTGFALVEAFALPTQSPASECSQSVMLCAPVGVAESGERVEKSGIISKYIEQDILALLGEERSSAYSARRPLMEMGLDSIELVELKSLVRGRFGVKLPPAFLFEHETQEKIAEALAPLVPEEQLRELAPGDAPAPSGAGEASPKPEIPRAARSGPAAEEDAVAIVGMACRFAGGADSPEAFWKLLERGEHGIVRMPSGRWQWPSFVDLEGRHKGIDQAGFLERIDEFDARFFRTSPKEAELMDPQQRLLLELSWEALEDAGHRPSELAGRKIGVFVGVCQSDYRDVLVTTCDSAEGYVGSGSAFAMLSNRLSYFYDFKGPSLTVDTACSSSLFALHDAVKALRRGECEQALVGAANLLCSPTISISYHEAGMLSPTGRCRTFDESADGYVRGEGGAMLLLKPLSLAVEHGDSIYGLVKGTAVNHGGQASTLTAPKPDAQADVIEAAWREAGAAPDTVGYVEAHGTGTPLGDPIEISGLTEAFRRLYQAEGKAWPPKAHCGLGSVKSNVGHLEGAAGLAGLIKILLAIERQQIPKTLNFRRLNPEIDLVGGPFYILERNQDWPAPHDEQGRVLPRRAGVSSFGFGGANSHAVLEEYREEYRDAGSNSGAQGPFLIPLSARTQEELVERARGLLDFVERLGASAGRGQGVERTVAGLRDILRQRFDLEDCAPELEWEELGWGPVETRLFLAAVEEAHGVRLHSRSLIENPSLRSLAESIVRERGDASPGGEGSGQGANLGDVAFTLQVGREPMAERAAFVVVSAQELASALRCYIQGERNRPGCYCGFARAGGERREAEPGLSGRDLPTLASRWVQGAEIDWEKLYSTRPRGLRRVHLPTYPFARQRYWVSSKNRAQARREEPVSHPLLNQRNSIPEHRFSAVLTGSEFFLADHVVQGRRLLPAVAYLEMARAAVERASGTSLNGGVWLKSVAWVRPLFVDGSPAQVHLRLKPESVDELSFEIYSGPEERPGETVFLGQGRAGIGAAAAAPVLDVEKVRARCTRASYSGEDCYRAFTAMGYGYGPAHRAIENLFVGSDEILARLKLPTSLSKTQDEFVLHPALADAAVQATIGFALAERRSPGDAVRPAVPFELQSAEVFRPCTTTMWAAIRRSDGSRNGNEVGTFDIDLCDESGRLSARLRGWTTRRVAEAQAGPAAGEMLLAPVWEPTRIETREVPAGPTAIVGGTGSQQATVQERLASARPLSLEAEDSIEQMRRKIAAWGEIGHIVWILPEHRVDSSDDEALLAAQGQGVLFGFRLIKAMLGEGYGERPLTWTVITTATQATHPEEAASPAHASVHGLIGCMAKEQTDWTVRLVDLPSAGEWPWQDVLALAGDPHGNAVAYRDGRWYRQQLTPYRPAEESGVEAYRPGGVYVVIGGAGGIGEAWSEALLRRMPVRLVWIGRRPKDDAIQARLDRLARLGPAPLYLAADATDREQLEAARDTIHRELGPIHGVIHAAIVLHDRTLANMTEEDFRTGLAPKVDVCVRLAQVFGKEPLDHVLFFSSVLAFLKTPGQSNYIAGCTFKDAFANRLASEWPCRVRVINWGYWAGLGAAASERHRSAMARKGFDSIELPRAMKVLDLLLSGQVRQLVYLKASDPTAFEGVTIPSSESAIQYKETLPSCIDDLRQVHLEEGEGRRLSASWSLANQEFEESLLGLLWAQLSTMGLLQRGDRTLAEVRRRAGIADRFTRWLERSVSELEARGYTGGSGRSVEEVWQAWEKRKGEWLRDADWQAQVQLAEAALRALPDILSGRCAPTDVLIGDLLNQPSTSAVAQVYRTGPLSRLSNEILADVVSKYLEERRRRDPDCRIRILEIGAGTGATTEAVIDALSPRARSVEEYLFTDLSRAFLAVAKKGLPAHPEYLKYQVFNAEAPPAEQEIEPGGYDVVIATNVLHATKDISRTLRNAKALLQTNGLLVLNEIATNSLFHHLTFGLLEGWWLFEDPEVRLPGGPALRPASWEAVLERESFRSVFFPAEALHEHGQQVIVAESDGFVRQSSSSPSPEPDPQVVEHLPGDRGTPAQDLDPVEGLAEVMGQPREGAVEHLARYLRRRVAQTLGVEEASLDSRSRPFVDALLGEFGVDSLSSNSLRNTMRQELGVDIPVQKIISEKVRRIVDALYEQLLLKQVSHAPQPESDEETETFVF